MRDINTDITIDKLNSVPYGCTMKINVGKKCNKFANKEKKIKIRVIMADMVIPSSFLNCIEGLIANLCLVFQYYIDHIPAFHSREKEIKCCFIKHIRPYFEKVLEARSSQARAAVRDSRGRYFLMKAIIIWRGDRDEILLGREVIFRFDDYIFGEHLRRAGTEPRVPQAPFADLYVFKHIN